MKSAVNNCWERTPFRELTALCLTTLLLVAGCLGNPSRDPVLVQDLTDYTGKIVEWEGVEKRVLRALSRAERTQFIDDDYVASTLQEVMPDIRLHVERISRYTPRTKAVLKIHRHYLDTWRKIADSFALTIESMDNHNYIRLSEGVAGMRYSRQELIKVAAEISNLLNATGVTPPPSRPPLAAGNAQARKNAQSRPGSTAPTAHPSSRAGTTSKSPSL